MAKRVVKCTYGIDVAKAWLDIYCAADDRMIRIDNDARSIETWLQGLNGPARLAVEATNRFHEAVVGQADQQGHRVYVEDEAGVEAGFSNEAYRDVGATVVYSDEEVRLRSEMLIRLSPPTVAIGCTRVSARRPAAVRRSSMRRRTSPAPMFSPTEN